MMDFAPVKEQMDLIKRGAHEIIPESELILKLENSLKTQTPLIVKLGCDPSRPDLHIGHGVVLRKLRHFQDLGHQAVLVIGDFTAMIGDPSGRNKTRPPLDLEQARENAKSYVDQAKIILDINTLKVKYNADWLNKLNFNDIVKLTSKYTVARMLERDDFTKRFKSEIPISIHEFLYPLAQGQDSVELKSDIELGGTDQKFNLLLGRDLQKSNGQTPQCIITTPLIEGTDGVEKMSKSYGNDISLNDSPNDMYGKTLSIPDEQIEKWFVLAADANGAVIRSIRKKLNDPNVNPMSVKKQLAKTLVELFYNKEKADSAEKNFQNVIIEKNIPKDIPIYPLKQEDLIVNVIFSSGMLKSKGEARRMIKQGAVKIDGDTVNDIYENIKPGPEKILKVGKRRFLRIMGK
tara:strand:- start:1407 stop:2621 length:1215 start_codon:yes stop_codon:yes gene_type:complete